MALVSLLYYSDKQKLPRGCTFWITKILYTLRALYKENLYVYSFMRLSNCVVAVQSDTSHQLQVTFKSTFKSLFNSIRISLKSGQTQTDYSVKINSCLDIFLFFIEHPFNINLIQFINCNKLKSCCFQQVSFFLLYFLN